MKNYTDKVDVPKGGGALSGLGESYQATHFSGAGSYQIPIPFPSARGTAPGIGLSYSSGSGNSSFGMGFSLGLASISIKTSKGLPTYTPKDVYLLNDAELTPELDNNGIPVSRYGEDGYKVTTYKSRIEGSFSLIEKHSHPLTSDSYWVVRSNQNVLSIYGQAVTARITDPEHEAHIFQWFLQEQISPNGNRVCYHYRTENYEGLSIDTTSCKRPVNTYLDYVEYGNYFKDSEEYFAYKGQLIYNELDPGQPTNIDAANWLVRPDPFSSFKSGFEIRNFRRCHGIAVYHQFDGLFNNEAVLSKLLHLNYNESNIGQYAGMSFLEKATAYSYRQDEAGNYDYKWLPPLMLEYQNCDPLTGTYKKLNLEGSTLLPGYLWEGDFTALDLYAEGLPGFLLSNEQSTFYWEPIGNGKYAGPILPEQFPANKNIQTAQIAITDLDGGGYKSLVAHDKQRTGFYEFDQKGKWAPYTPFVQNATELSEAQMIHLDLNGNGLADLAVFEDTFIRWYPSLGKKGYGEARTEAYPPNFPAVENTSQEVYIGFNNMNGDGLSDRVKVENGNVLYWPNKGYGRFAAAKVMENAPQFPNGLNTQYLHFADIDGSGTTDIIYLQHDQVLVWFNQSGNRFSSPVSIPLPATLRFDSISKVNFADILGNGTNCMVLTRIEPEVEHYYYDIAGQNKPYLLKGIDNNSGAVTAINYTTSVKEYLKDKQKGRTSPTRLFFPVQLVEQVELRDLVSGTFHLSRHAYHDGYFDPYERVFRGFGFVETWDSTHYQEFAETAAADDQAVFSPQTINEQLHVPPTYTKTWYHTGAYRKAGTIEATYQEEYFQGDDLAQSIPGNSFADATGNTDQINWEPQSYRQAFTALNGQMLRQEVYGLDDSDQENIPFTVSESSVQIRLIQARFNQRYAVFFPVVVESIIWHYERNPADPNVVHTFNSEVDLYGNILQACTVNYPRRAQSNHPVFPEQQVMHIIAKQNSLANKIEPNCRWIGVVYENQSFQIKSLNHSTALWTYEEAKNKIADALNNILTYNSNFSDDATPEARLLSHSKHLFWNEDQSEVAELGELTSLNLPHHEETAMGTDDFYSAVYEDKIDVALMETEGGFVYENETGYWWNFSSVTSFHNSDKFYLHQITENSRVGEASSLFAKEEVFYDDYSLFPTGVRAYLSDTEYLENNSEIDYQALQTWRAIDQNGNVSEVLFDAFGMVIVSTRYGQTMGEAEGNAPVSDYQIMADADFESVLSNPADYLQHASTYIYYDHLAWMNKQEPPCSITLTGEKYQSQLTEGETGNIQVGITYSDGMGRALESKLKTNAGPVHLQTSNGILLNPAEANNSDNWSEERWIVSGRTVYNNKGKPAQQYLSYYSDTPHYENQSEIEMEGIVPPPSILHYDALERVIRTDTPKGFHSKVEFTPWLVRHFDVNDTVMDSYFYENNKDNSPLDAGEQDALDKALPCQNTPDIQIMDNLSRVIRIIKDNLGVLHTNSFEAVCTDGDWTSEEVFNQLIVLGILTEQSNDSAVLSERTLFWNDALVQTINDNFESIANDLLAFLYQGRITTLMTYDIQGRNIRSVDSRLFYQNVLNQSINFNLLHTYDMSGVVLYTESCDAGKSWTFDNQFGKPIYNWDSRDFIHQHSYDRLQRPVEHKIIGGDYNLNNVVSTIIYGETLANASNRNIRGKAYQTFDQAGLITSEIYTIDGHPLATGRQLRDDYKTEANWTNAAKDAVRQTEVFETVQKMDAIGKLLEEILPDNSKLLPVYNQVGNIKSLQVHLNEAAVANTVIENIEYDVHHAPTSVTYGNGVIARMTYEATTRRLIRYKTYRTNQEQDVLQDITYTYDPTGNITQRVDTSSDSVFHANQEVQPLSEYTYDRIYRLIRATGRQIRYTGVKPADTNWLKENGVPFHTANPNDSNQLENYTETFQYDTESNLLELHHQAASNSWQRQFEMNASSNRLAEMDYDGNGNMLTLEHLYNLRWDYRNNLAAADIVSREDNINDGEYYIYDGNGHRVRKVTQRLVENGNIEIKDKIYLGNFQRTQTYIQSTTGTLQLIKENQTIRAGTGNKLVCLIQECTSDPEDEARYRYQLMDGDHSVSMEVDQSGALITYEEYFPYGATAFSLGKNEVEVKLKIYKYSGEEQDATGLYYYGARYYPPWLYRWLKPDPAGTIDGLNLYVFVGGSPVTHIDIGGFARGKKKKSTAPKSGVKPAIAKKSQTKEILINLTHAQIIQNLPSNVEVDDPPEIDIHQSSDWNKLKNPIAAGLKIELNVHYKTKAGTIKSKSAVLENRKHKDGGAPNYFLIRSAGYGGGRSTKYIKFYSGLDSHNEALRLAARVIKGTAETKGSKTPTANAESSAILFGSLAMTSERTRGIYAPYVALIALGAKKYGSLSTADDFVKAYIPAPEDGAQFINYFTQDLEGLLKGTVTAKNFKGWHGDFLDAAKHYFTNKQGKEEINVYNHYKSKRTSEVKSIAMAFLEFRAQQLTKYKHLS